MTRLYDEKKIQLKAPNGNDFRISKLTRLHFKGRYEKPRMRYILPQKPLVNLILVFRNHEILSEGFFEMVKNCHGGFSKLQNIIDEYLSSKILT